MECAIVQDGQQHKALLHSDKEPANGMQIVTYAISIIIIIIIIIFLIFLQSYTRVQVEERDNTEHIARSKYINWVDPMGPPSFRPHNNNNNIFFKNEIKTITHSS